MSDYNYDEEGQLWPFFVFLLLLGSAVPLPGLLGSRPRAAKAVTQRPLQYTYQSDNAATVKAEKRSYQRAQRNIGLAITVVLLWAVMAYMLYLIRITPAPENKLWNPYDILGISEV